MLPLLDIKNLSVDFISGQEITHALKNISLSVNRGEIVALVGESGSGKSVTSLSILQLLPSPPAKYSTGEILFSENGAEQSDLLQRNRHEMQDIRGNKIAMIFQEPMTSLNPVLTCGNQVMEAIILHKKVTATEAKQQTLAWFEKVKLPDPPSVFNRYPHQLSGGQKQRVMIAIAMCCEPSLLICDEPTTALDVTVQKIILQLIKELQEQLNMGVIFITHDLGVVAEIADRAVVMYKGEIVEQGTVKDIFYAARHPYTKALLACRPVNHERGKRLPVVSDFLEKTEDRSPKAEAYSPQPAAQSQQPDKKNENRTALLQVQHLSVWFPAKKTFFGKTLSFTKAVDDVSFDLYKGETLGLVGESGCGKTTLGRALLRLIEPTSGTIIYDGIDLTAKKRDELRSLRKEVQIVFQDPYSSLNPRITIGSAIAEPMKVHGILSSDKQRRDRVTELLEKVNLKAEHFGRYPHEFSGGQRQRIVIARALALNPSFIICDESVSALDVSVQAQVLNLLGDLKKEFGFTVIFISHDLAVVRYTSDRIMVMNKGKIEESGPADEVYFNPQTEYTKKLIASIPKGLPVDAEL
ncbi:MAG TPA: ABC transporter ATP-binding protein [Chitinophagaceae bacterium]|jgi:peptide/nickel transport system ATP-binding protein|nr:ABC transporter ATP-binding protein [Chitinophagaceae bacterium]